MHGLEGSGRQVINKFIDLLPEYLERGGRLLMVQSTLSNLEETLSLLRDRGFAAEIIDEVKLFFETIALIEAKKV